MNISKNLFLFCGLLILLQFQKSSAMNPKLDKFYNDGFGVGTFYINEQFIPNVTYKFQFSNDIGLTADFGYIQSETKNPDPLKNGYDKTVNRNTVSPSLSIDFNVFADSCYRNCLTMSPFFNYTSHITTTDNANYLGNDPQLIEKKDIVSFGMKYQYAKFIYRNNLSFELSAFTIYSKSLTNLKVKYSAGETSRDTEIKTNFSLISSSFQLTFRYWFSPSSYIGCTD